MKKRLTIKNSTAEFLIFTSQSNADGIEVRVEDENVWLTQKLIAKLFDVVKSNISEHLKDIFDSNELSKKATVWKFRTVQIEGKRIVSRDIEHYNLEIIIALGYRINSEAANNNWNKKNTIVEITLPENNNQIFPSKYMKVLPSKDELKRAVEEMDDVL
ncbi:MAG: virulence RhuM family protein [Spirochaetaceae bacterium]|nr:virulence RhuM family protein [Spirochaetaceae bacterium]